MLAAACFSSCREKTSDTPETPSETPSKETAKADQFAQDVLGSYYLWSSEISKDLARLDSDTCLSPMAVVDEIRYHESGTEVDHWTMLTDDLKSFTNSVQGLGVTYGYSLAYGGISGSSGTYFLLIEYVSKNSPAQKAGLKRGDIIITLNGAEITSSNINDAVNSTSITLGITGIEYQNGMACIGSDVKSVSLVAEDMYEDPVLISKTFDIDGKKVGYLLYNSFDLKSSQTLPDVFRQFKSDGIKELVLDLRFNGGGYLFTESVLASLIAPKSSVDSKSVLQTEVYNDYLTKMWKSQSYDTNTYLSNTFSYDDEAGTTFDIDISDANPGISKITFIVTGGSASASEALIVGLSPYMDVSLVGEQTYGKYCAGYLLAPSDFYNKRYDYSLITDWGIYVMVSKFADKNGNNAAIPAGIVPDIEIEDDPLDGCQLGDEDETMLKAALTSSGKVYTKTNAESYRSEISVKPLERGMKKGILIKSGKPPVIQ